MQVATHGRASFGTQANAVLRKNICYQKRNKKENCCLVLFPLISVILLGMFERYLYKLGVAAAGVGQKKKPKAAKVEITGIKNPSPWPPLLEIPIPGDRAVKTKFMPFSDLPPLSARDSGDAPVTFLITGSNQSFGMGVAEKMFPPVFPDTSTMGSFVMGSLWHSETYLMYLNLTDPVLRYIQPKCKNNDSVPFPPGPKAMFGLSCLEGLCLWRNSSSDINVELYKGSGGNEKEVTNTFAAGIDMLNSNRNNLNISFWANPNNASESLTPSYYPSRWMRLINMATKAYIQHTKGPGTEMSFEFVKEVPTIVNISATMSGMFAGLLDMLLRTVCVVLPLHPFGVILTTVVYEKQKRLRIMMKMHGLRDTAYWAIAYIYSFSISVLFILFFVIGGKLSGLAIFSKNSLSLQMVFYFLHVNWQIGFAFLIAAFVTSVRTSQVLATMLKILVALIGILFFSNVIDSDFYPKYVPVLVEIIPGFALYRGAYEFQKYATFARDGAEEGMKWHNLSDSTNGLKTAMMIMFIEWKVMLSLAYYFDQVIPSGSGHSKSPLFFLKTSKKKPLAHPSLQPSGSYKDNTDVAHEREKVERLVTESSRSYTAICHDLKKIYPGRDGNPAKAAVRGLSLALPTSECFGMLGPNGAGKTSFISMMIGLTEPTSGTAYIEGLDLTSQMDEIYSCMGVCPQFDLLWDTLTAREHLYFYGRLKNLAGAELDQAVDESLKAVNLYNGGVADKHSGKYSGGMKRRLSVAISLIGDPKIVYLDEPSTGLDPASRNQLWTLVKRAKQNRAILLTTHSMEEAEALCDRLGVFVDGALRCVGNSRELKARYGGYFIFTMTTPVDREAEVEEMIVNICSGAHKTYHLGGTQKFELPKHEVRLADIFELVENAKRKFTVQAWALADTTLEDVFIKVTRQAQAKSSDDHS